MTGDGSVRDGSTVVAALSAIRARLRDVVVGSRLVGFLVDLWDRIRPTGPGGGADEEGGPRFGVLRGSVIWRVIRGLWVTLSIAAGQSRLSRLVGRVQGAVRASWLYRWLTAEPDPDVVVIDLRETLTVGPLIAAVDRTIRWLLPVIVSSILFRAARQTCAVTTARPIRMLSLFVGSAAAGLLALIAATGDPSPAVVVGLAALVLLAILGSRSDRSWQDLQENRWMQSLVAAFEPPEPPSRDDGPPPWGEDGDQPTDREEDSGSDG